eukprot:365182-Chlamydomonas_euryale.AAC.1
MHPARRALSMRRMPPAGPGETPRRRPLRVRRSHRLRRRRPPRLERRPPDRARRPPHPACRSRQQRGSGGYCPEAALARCAPAARAAPGQDAALRQSWAPPPFLHRAPRLSPPAARPRPPPSAAGNR